MFFLFWFVVVGSPLVTAEQKSEINPYSPFSLRPSRLSSWPYSIFSTNDTLGPSASILVLRHIYACLDYHPCIFTSSRTLSHELSLRSVDPSSPVRDTAKEQREQRRKQRTSEILPLPQTWVTTIKIQSPSRPAVQEPPGQTGSRQGLDLTHSTSPLRQAQKHPQVCRPKRPYFSPTLWAVVDRNPRVARTLLIRMPSRRH